MQVDLASFLAAIIENAGGEVQIPYELWRNQHGDKNIAIDVINDGHTFSLKLIDTKDVKYDDE